MITDTQISFCWDKTAEADMRQKALDLASSVNSIPGYENPTNFLQAVVRHLKILNRDRLIDFNWDHIQHQMNTSEITWTERDPPRDRGLISPSSSSGSPAGSQSSASSFPSQGTAGSSSQKNIHYVPGGWMPEFDSGEKPAGGSDAASTGARSCLSFLTGASILTGNTSR